MNRIETEVLWGHTSLGSHLRAEHKTGIVDISSRLKVLVPKALGIWWSDAGCDGAESYSSPWCSTQWHHDTTFWHELPQIFKCHPQHYHQ